MGRDLRRLAEERRSNSGFSVHKPYLAPPPYYYSAGTSPIPYSPYAQPPSLRPSSPSLATQRHSNNAAGYNLPSQDDDPALSAD